MKRDIKRRESNMLIDRRDPHQFVVDLSFELATQLSLREIELKATRVALLDTETEASVWYRRYRSVCWGLAVCAAYSSLATGWIIWFLLAKG